MAMNKAERCAMDRLEKELAHARALGWPSYEKPKRAKINATGGGPLFVGWTFNAYNNSISQGCSNGVNHSTSRTDTTTTQRAEPHEGFFVTRIEAIQALRHEATRQCAERLAKIDAMLAAPSPELTHHG